MYMNFVSWYEILDLYHFMCNRFRFRSNCDKFKDVTRLILRLSESVYDLE